MNENDDIYNFDELQKTLCKPNIIKEAEDYLESVNIDKVNAKSYLSARLFVEFPTFFENLSNELLDLANQVFLKVDLQTLLPNYKNAMNEWKSQNSLELITELHEMKQRTRASSSETENVNCISCYETQEKIIDVAERYFSNQCSKTS